MAENSDFVVCCYEYERPQLRDAVLGFACAERDCGAALQLSPVTYRLVSDGVRPLCPKCGAKALDVARPRAHAATMGA